MSKHTTKDFFGDGYTTTHEDGSKSHTTKDFFGDGYTTTHEDGSRSHTTKDFFGDGTTTYHEDGSRSHTTKDFFGDGYTTTHEDGSTSHTTKDFFGDGYTTHTNRPGQITGGEFGYIAFALVLGGLIFKLFVWDFFKGKPSAQIVLPYYVLSFIGLIIGVCVHLYKITYKKYQRSEYDKYFFSIATDYYPYAIAPAFIYIIAGIIVLLFRGQLVEGILGGGLLLFVTALISAVLTAAFSFVVYIYYRLFKKN